MISIFRACLSLLGFILDSVYSNHVILLQSKIINYDGVYMLWLMLACTSQSVPIIEEALVSETPKIETVSKQNNGQNKRQKVQTNNGNLPPKQPSPEEGGPQGGGPQGKGNLSTGSGAAFQDPSGFPAFHAWKAPEGVAISQKGDWSEPIKLTEKPEGGYRPQIVVSRKDLIHVVYYERQDAGDIIHHRMSRDKIKWSPAKALGHKSERNWGPDIISKEDGRIVMVYDHALADFSSRGFMTVYDEHKGNWTDPEPLTPDNGGEIGSGHIADAGWDDLVYVFIGKNLGEEYRFQAKWRWFSDGKWSDINSFSDGTADAWHTNVERRPDGSVVAGFDIGTGGEATILYFAEGKDGTFSDLVNITATGKPGERPHFAFSKTVDYVTWFHKEGGQPKFIYVRSHDRETGDWSEVEEPSVGYGGFHFDPEIAINKDGVLCLIWGWDQGRDAEMVYSLNKGDGWSKPSKIADIDWGKPGLASLAVD
jgi:hypothetical protein